MQRDNAPFILPFSDYITTDYSEWRGREVEGGWCPVCHPLSTLHHHWLLPSEINRSLLKMSNVWFLKFDNTLDVSNLTEWCVNGIYEAWNYEFYL